MLFFLCLTEFRVHFWYERELVFPAVEQLLGEKMTPSRMKHEVLLDMLDKVSEFELRFEAEADNSTELGRLEKLFRLSFSNLRRVLSEHLDDEEDRQIGYLSRIRESEFSDIVSTLVQQLSVTDLLWSVGHRMFWMPFWMGANNTGLRPSFRGAFRDKVPLLGLVLSEWITVPRVAAMMRALEGVEKGEFVAYSTGMREKECIIFMACCTIVASVTVLMSEILKSIFGWSCCCCRRKNNEMFVEEEEEKTVKIKFL